MAAAAYHVEEEHLWKCPKHPSKRRRNGGICPSCLRDRLDNLCPNCGNLRPCPCLSAAASPSSSCSSDHSFHRSRSLAIPFLRSNTKSPSFLSGFRRSKTKKGEIGDDVDVDRAELESNQKIENFAMMITKSRSVSVGTTSSKKGKFWHRINAFNRPKNPKVIAIDRSPLHRG